MDSAALAAELDKPLAGQLLRGSPLTRLAISRSMAPLGSYRSATCGKTAAWSFALYRHQPRSKPFVETQPLH